MGLAGSAGVEFYANTAKFQEGVRQAQKASDGFRAGLQTMEGHSRKLQNALFNLAGEATGLRGPLGKIAEIGISMGAGGWAGIAAAGIATIAMGFREWQKAAEDAFSATEKLLKPMRERRAEADKFIEEQKRLKYIKESLDRGIFPVLTAGETKAAGISLFLGDRDSNMRALRKWVDETLSDLNEALERQMYQMPEITVTAKKGSPAQRLIGADPQEGAKAMERLLRRVDEVYQDWLDRAAADQERKSKFWKAILPDPDKSPVGPDTALPDVTIPKSVQRMIDDAARWRDAWLQARQAVQYAISDLFMSIVDHSQNALDILKQLLLTLARIAANMLANQIVNAVMPVNAMDRGIGGGAGAVNLTVNQTTNVSTIDGAGMDAAIMRSQAAVTAAVAQGIQQSQGLAFAIRGW